MESTEAHRRGWILDIVLGGIVGGIVGAIIAVNVAIFSGIDTGYQSSLSALFDYNGFVGLIVVAILVAGPVVGVVVARRFRHNRANVE